MDKGKGRIRRKRKYTKRSPNWPGMWKPAPPEINLQTIIAFREKWGIPMNLTKDLRSGNWRASFRTVDGKRRTLTTRTANRQEAQQIAKQAGLMELETAARVGRLTNEAIALIATGRKITMLGAVEPWLARLRSKGRSENTISLSKTYLIAFIRESNTGTLAPCAVTYDQVSCWVNREDLKLKAGSRAVGLSALRSFFRFCLSNGWCAGNPAQDAEVNLGKLSHAQKEPRARDAFTDDEIAALLAATSPGSFWRAAIAIGRWTGLRLSDVACLEWASLTTPGRITVWTTKRDKRVDLPLEPAQLAMAIAEIKHEDPKLCWPEQAAIAKDPKRRSLLSVQFGRLCEQCGIVGKSFHNTRHSYVTAQRAAGVPIEHISVAVGHSSPHTTLGYAH